MTKTTEKTAVAQTSANPFGVNSGATIDVAALAAKAAESAQNNPRGGGAPGGADYLNFSGKTGMCTIGKDNREIEKDEKWLLNVTSFEAGWVCWKDSKPVGNRLSNIFSGVPVPTPDPEEGGPFNVDKPRGEGWHQAKAFVVKSIDFDQQGYFKNNSVSGVGAISDLEEAFSERAAIGSPSWPVISFRKEQFTAQGYKNFKPVFHIHGWLTTDQAMGVTADSDLDALFAESGDAAKLGNAI